MVIATKRADRGVLEKIERDCLKLIDCLQEFRRERGEQSLRRIAERTGMSKDEVNRYLSPQVSELYNFERLMHARTHNRSLYNWLIVSGPPMLEAGKWAGIMTNTSKFGVFRAVCMKYGYEVRHIGGRGQIVDLVYRGIHTMSTDRIGKVFSSQEPILQFERFRA
ncbi:MAG: hypothetical protein HY556_02195 [Euryarchaeota archaeon]|nr:hypothetical protein [Euryarchaeota archaeon]